MGRFPSESSLFLLAGITSRPACALCLSNQRHIQQHPCAVHCASCYILDPQTQPVKAEWLLVGYVHSHRQECHCGGG